MRKRNFFYLPKKRALFKYASFLSVIGCVSALLFIGIVRFNFFATLQQSAEASKDESVLSVTPDKKIKFPYTDDNRNENLIIKTDEKIYYGISSAEVNFSVSNTGGKKEMVGLQAYFPEENGQVKKIEQWTKDMPYTVSVADFGPVDYSCKEKWQKMMETTSPKDEMNFTFYLCSSTKEKKPCNELSEDEKICHIESEESGSHMEKRFKDGWKEISTQNKALSNRQTIVDKILFKTPPVKKISRHFKVKKSTDEKVEIKDGETQYFRMEIEFSSFTSGEFYIEAIGKNGGYGLLDPWFDSGWQYRKSLTVNGTTAGALTNHQMEIVVHYGSGSDSGKDVYCSSNCRTDFGDIRFTKSDGETELDYWMKSYTDSNNAVFWVEIDSIPASPSSINIYAYYGNSGVSTSSNGSNTFAFFDDFSSDLSKWSVDAANTDKVTISSGALRHDPDTTQSRNAYFDTRLRTATYKITNGVLEYDAYLAGTTSSTPRIIHQFGWRVQSLNFENGYSFRLQNSSADGGHMRFATSWTPFGTAYPATAGNVWHSVKEVVSGSSYTAYVDGGSAYSGTDSTKTTSDYLISHVHGVTLGVSSYVLVDNVRVRNYASPDATYGSWGSEEPRPAEVSIILDTDGSVAYGTVATSENTTSSGVDDTQTVRNNGNVAEDFDIKGQNSADWTLSATGPGSAIYKHEWCTQNCDTTAVWNAFATSYLGNYLVTNVAANGTQSFDLKITVPTSNPGTNQQNADVYIQATEH